MCYECVANVLLMCCQGGAAHPLLLHQILADPQIWRRPSEGCWH
jgi:hypothetical protein